MYNIGWRNKKKLSPDGSELNQLSCLKLFRQIQLICAHINMDSTAKNWKPYSVGRLLLSLFLIWGTDRWNGNNTELSPFQSVVIVIIPVINKIGRARSGSPICSLRASLQTKLDDTKSYYKLIINIYYFPAILEGQKSGEVAKSSI